MLCLPSEKVVSVMAATPKEKAAMTISVSPSPSSCSMSRSAADDDDDDDVDDDDGDDDADDDADEEEVDVAERWDPTALVPALYDAAAASAEGPTGTIRSFDALRAARASKYLCIPQENESRLALQRSTEPTTSPAPINKCCAWLVLLFCGCAMNVKPTRVSAEADRKCQSRERMKPEPNSNSIYPDAMSASAIARC